MIKATQISVDLNQALNAKCIIAFGDKLFRAFFSILSSAHPFVLSRIFFQSFSVAQHSNFFLFSLHHFLLSWDMLELLVFPSTPCDHALSEQVALDDSSRLECPSFSLILYLFFKHLFIQMERWGRVTNEIGNWE